MRAWYMDNDPSDQRHKHFKTPGEYLQAEDVYKTTGVEYIPVNLDTYEEDGELERIKKKRGYTFEDEITCSKECLENYEEKLKTFYKEHLHTDEEIRFILEGSGYFDVRDNTDEWVRIEVTPGDLIIVPSGIYHRFTLDTKNYIRVKRLFVGEPIWTPHNRPAEDMECRKHYLKNLGNGFQEKVISI